MFWADFQLDLKTYLKKDISLKEHDLLFEFNNPKFCSNGQFVINLVIIILSKFIKLNS